MKVTIRDIAERANTSIATVSYVLNNNTKHRISDETRQRILKCAEELHYRPNATAKSFKTGIKKTVGFIGPAVDNYFWASMVENMEQVLSNNGYSLIIANARENPDKEINDIKMLSSGLVDGLILESTLTDCQTIDQVVPEHFPIVFIDRALSNCRHDAIFISTYTCLYESVRNMIARNHQRIGFLAGLHHLSTTIERLRAYQSAMDDAHLSCGEFIRYEESVNDDLVSQLSDLVAQGCTALVASTSRITYAVAVWLKRNHLSDSIELLGCHDDVRDFEMIQSVGLISKPAAQMGQKAAETIIHRIQSPDAPISIVSLQSELHWFGSPLW